ncbi:outer membrane family protein [Helicobacter pylori]|nr:outer membrane family protein [Helicobacter pylori]
MKKSWQAFLFFGAVFNASLQGFEAKLTGFVDQSSTIGFNQHKIDKARGIYPMQQYATIAGYLGLGFNLLPKKVSDHVLKGKIGGIVGSIFYDGTRKFEDGSVAYNLFGYYDGFMGGATNILQSDDLATENMKYNQNVRNYVFSDAYLEYSYKDYFEFKAGRYLSTMPFRSAQTQGFQVSGQYKKARLTWFSSFGRAFAFGSFLLDWYAARTTYSGGFTKNDKGGYDSHGKKVLYGTHAVQLTYKPQRFLVEAFYYFSPQIFNAPGVKIGWDSNPNFSGTGFRSDTSITGFFPIYYPWMVVKSDGSPVYRYDTPATQYGQNLMIRQRFDINNYNVSIAFYQVFQNANGWIGNMGNPSGVMMGNNSVYAGSTGTALKRNASTILVSCGGTHFAKKFTWKFATQYSTSVVSWEARATLSLGYKFSEYLSGSIDLAYYGIHTNKGFKVGENGPVPKDFPALYSDRSALYTALVASF